MSPVKFALAPLVAALLVAPAVPAFAQQTVAVVDLQRAIRNSKEGKAAEAKLQEMGNQKRDEFKPKEEQIQRMQELSSRSDGPARSGVRSPAPTTGWGWRSSSLGPRFPPSRRPTWTARATMSS